MRMLVATALADSETLARVAPTNTHESRPHRDPAPVMLCAEVLMIRLILADDHAVVRAGIRSVLARELDVAVVAEAEDGWRALAAVEAHPEADVLLLDLGMPRLGGMEVLRRIQTRGSRLAVLVLSAVGLTIGATGDFLKW